MNEAPGQQSPEVEAVKHEIRDEHGDAANAPSATPQQEEQTSPETFPAVSVPSTTGPQPPDSASEPQVVETEAGVVPGEPIPGTTAPQPLDVTSDVAAGGNVSVEVASGAALGTPAPQPFNDPSVDPGSAAELETEATE
jgi:hypothetical protein